MVIFITEELVRHQPMRILLLGGSGLVGSRIKYELNQKYNLYCPAREELDLSNIQVLGSVPDEYDVIIHAAQFRDYSNTDMNEIQLKALNAVNALSLQAIVEKKKKIKQIIYMSTGGVYKRSHSILNEDSEILEKDDANPYFRSKIKAESVLNEMNKSVNVCVLRLFTIYGKNANSTSLFPRLQEKIQNREKIVIASNGGTVLRPTHVNDVASCVQKVIAKGSTGIYNLGGPELLNFSEIIRRFAMYLKLDVTSEDSDSESFVLAPDNLALQRDIFSPERKFDGNWQV